ncbi:Phage-associated protein (Modular protein) [Planktothrix tepida]|uniref:Phage-associated protein (Modular protein) n=2 Tax=Planktothrix TaxID=54304 RepID=A0A1J1LJT9_9CYAN|nr:MULTISPECIES: type II toxin-antitoxin system antitoxin SocA domain-containing protein [Planktothrix]CAD5935341.1 Phage-associated protein (Modular protein) [Planktothrix tepida]CAD5976181.1 Phage-associated protein (Modular protein) [Planktothrix pseudagardhii]CUR31849.1 Phage-associated protein (modular protein) [Planktothrix tepida PCC 9214]
MISEFPEHLEEEKPELTEPIVKPHRQSNPPSLTETYIRSNRSWLTETYIRSNRLSPSNVIVDEDLELDARKGLSETEASNALDIAKYLITLASPEEEDLMTNLRLQKLLYYAQGFHLALFGKRLFSEKIEAWQYGPVVPDVYRIYKQYGSNPLPQPDDFNIDQYSQETQELLDEVYEVYGQYTAPILKRFTDQEPPYKETDVNEEIALDLMKAYFETQVVK